MISYIAMALWGLIAISMVGVVGVLLLLYRIITVAVSVTQELRWTAEAYTGREYEQEKKIGRPSDGHSSVTLEPPWSDDREGTD